MGKVVAIISKHPELKKLTYENDDVFAGYNARLSEIKKEMLAYKKTFWPRMEKALMEIGAVPADTDWTKHNIEIDDDADCIRISDKGDESELNGLKSLLKTLVQVGV